MHYFTKNFSTNGDDFIVLEPEDWTEEQFKAFLGIFGLAEAERIRINEFKLEVYGTDKPAYVGKRRNYERNLI